MALSVRPAIAGKIVVVTGASSGIGEATAWAFASAGATVALAARRGQRLERLAEAIHRAGGRALAVPTDLLSQPQITNLVQRTLEAFGRIDVLANIAGWGRYDWYEEFSPEDLRRQFEVNVVGLAELTRQVVPVMKRQRSGTILNMSSYASRIAVPPLAVYASTKYAIEGLSDGLRRELAPWGIHVIRVHPSGVPGTEFNRQAAQGGGIQFRSLPIGRVSKERVARELVRLVEHPRRELFLGRPYEVAVWLNRHLPGLVDWAMGTWVRWKRRAELSAGSRPAPKPLAARLPQAAALAAVLVVGAVLLGSLRSQRQAH